MRTLIAGLLLTTTAAAATAETRELGAHVHGEGQLNIAFDGNTVAMELTAPGADIVGFEHAAKSAEDRAAIEAAVATLSQPLSLFAVPDAAECTVTEASARLVTEGDDHGDEEHAHDDHGHDDHAHDDHGHDDHAHDDHGHEEHAHDDHGHDHDDGGHSEFRAEYTLTCGDAAAIDTVGMTYFEQFPNAQVLDVQIVMPEGARAVEVRRDAPNLSLSGRS